MSGLFVIFLKKMLWGIITIYIYGFLFYIDYFDQMVGCMQCGYRSYIKQVIISCEFCQHFHYLEVVLVSWMILWCLDILGT